ncbi:MAG: UvrD-helicase domain-containing protein [Flavobacteriales bacterium]|nr:UvrD-helicase domain-containing protein [Flavobacteriales bacterium]
MDFPQPFLVYKSSAGSGKTFNLAKVYLSLILTAKDPHYFKRILAITFTVKAAAEMKDRIITYLSILAGNETRKRSDAEFMLDALKEDTRLSHEEIKERSGQRLHQILHQYGEFNIVTIDKFFARLVRSFASDLSLAPDFEIQVDRSMFIDRAADLLFEKVGTDDDLTFLLLQMLRSRLADDQSNNADDVIENACRSLLSDEFYFARSKFKTWKPQAVFALKEQLDQDAEALTGEFIAPAKRAMEIFADRSIEAKDVYRGAQGIHTYFRRIAEGDLSKVQPNSYVLATIQEDKWMSGSKNPSIEDVKEDLKKCFEETLSSMPVHQHLQLINALRQEVYALGFYSALEDIFEWIREEDNIRLLSEFNTLISDQLQDEQTFFLFERLGTQFSHILIDEFQDTSVLQWKNLLPLVENSLSEGNTSLIVGDAKQSIYRWRNSDPEQFVKLPKVDHPSSGLLESTFKEIVLDQNFRSSQQIVNFNNRFFDQAHRSMLSEAHRGTYSTLEQHPVQEKAGEVNWWIDEDPKMNKNALMLKMLDRVRKMVDKDGVAPGDICGLFRTNADAAAFASMLLEAGFSVVSQESLLLKNNPLVQLLASTLQGLQWNKDPFITQLWFSRLTQHVNITNAHAKTKQVKQEKWSFTKTAKAMGFSFSTPEVQHGDTFQRAMAICKILHVPLENAFVSKFLDICLRYETSGGYLKEGFLEYWAKKAEDESIQLADNTNAISVMTIHKSKGLEFPVVVVFMPEVTKRKNTKEYGWVEIEEHYALGNVQLKLSQLRESHYARLPEEEDERSNLDLLNVLYVAFTRAERQLEIFSIGPKKENLLQDLFAWPEWDEQHRVLSIR